ncbi:hypothetical protein KUCAC02_011387, partial [Chaenocephalus aceratus]
ENSTDSSESAVVADLDSCQLCNSLGALQQLHWGERGGDSTALHGSGAKPNLTREEEVETVSREEGIWSRQGESQCAQSKVVTRQHCVSSVSVLFAFSARSLDLTCPGCLWEAPLFASGPSLEFVGYLPSRNPAAKRLPPCPRTYTPPSLPTLSSILFGRNPALTLTVTQSLVWEYWCTDTLHTAAVIRVHAPGTLPAEGWPAPPVNSLASNNGLQNETQQTELGGQTKKKGRLWKREINRAGARQTTGELNINREHVFLNPTRPQRLALLLTKTQKQAGS